MCLRPTSQITERKERGGYFGLRREHGPEYQEAADSYQQGKRCRGAAEQRGAGSPGAEEAAKQGDGLKAESDQD